MPKHAGAAQEDTSPMPDPTVIANEIFLEEARSTASNLAELVKQASVIVQDLRDQLQSVTDWTDSDEG
jgi:hypothetical protein